MTAYPRTSLSTDLRGIGAEVVITLAGVVASFATVAINLGLQRALDFDLLSLTVIVIIPAGAIYGGLASASGYYLAARATQTLANRRTLFEMLAIALSTWLLSHWVSYSLLRFSNGALLRDTVSFWDYFRLRTEHLRLTIESAGGSEMGRTGDLGLLGYVTELIQILGYLCGGFLPWLALKQAEACEPCGRYAKKKQLLRRVTSQAFDDVLRRATIALPHFAEQVRAAVGKRRLVGMSLRLVQCPACHRQWIRPAVIVMDGNHPLESQLAPHDVDQMQAKQLQELAA